MVPITATHAKEVLDLERLTGLQAQKMMQDGELTSVQLTNAYIDRIEALNKSGPGLNAVTQLNPNALKEAAASDKRRAMGYLLGPADGLPILMKDLIDVKGMYTSAGNYSLRNSYPATDASITENLRARGVVILGKLGLTEFANASAVNPPVSATSPVGDQRDRHDQNRAAPRPARFGDGRRARDARDRHGDLRLDHQPIPDRGSSGCARRSASSGDGIAPIDVSQDGRPDGADCLRQR
jgi:hypothetical protein